MKNALAAATTDYGKFGEAIFSDQVEWTIAGCGLVARAFRGMEDLIDNAAQALFDRWEGKAAVATKRVRADGDRVFAHPTSAAKAIDGLPHANGYLYILTVKDRRVVAGTAWLHLHAYYDVINRVKLPALSSAIPRHGRVMLFVSDDAPSSVDHLRVPANEGDRDRPSRPARDQEM